VVEQAINHLMRVSCGLDSLVLGEPQILGQIKQAYHNAKTHDAIGVTFDRLFQKTFSVAKQVRTSKFAQRQTLVPVRYPWLMLLLI
jgi:glutamyl-tRNA reductase